ncbi:MAG: hypothetical protein M3144_09700, partial [Actinomycetota bacterium]|nr:hypothetical protein [Actinomycetota bacterium]
MFEPRAGRNDVAEANDGRNLTLQHLSVPLVGYVTVLGLAGLLAVRGRGTGPLLIAAVVFTALSAVTVATPRMRAPLDIACCVGMGALAGRGAEAWKARQLRRAATSAAAQSRAGAGEAGKRTEAGAGRPRR